MKLRRPIVIAFAALAVGVAMSLLKGSGGGARLQLGNLSAPWLLVAFLAGSRYRRIGAAAGAGVLATIVALLGFYGEQSPIADFSGASVRFVEDPPQMWAFLVGPHGIVYAGGVATGLLFGALGHAWAARGSRLALGALAVAFLAEPVAQLGAGAMIGGGDALQRYWWLWLGEIVLGFVLLRAGLRARRFEHREA